MIWQKLGNLTFWLTWPLHRIYLSFTTRARVIVLAPDDQVLLVKGWLGSGEWGLPGGGIHGGESPEQGASRELAEETGLIIQPNQLRELKRGVTTDGGLKFKYVLFTVSLDEAAAVKKQKFEIIDAKWQPLEHLEGVSPATASLLEAWQQLN